MPVVLNRRLFLTQLAALGACSRAPEKPAAPPDIQWKLAIGLNGFGSSARLFRKRYEVAEVLEFARKEGFAGVELWAPFLDGYPDSSDESKIKALRDRFAEHGLKIFSIQAAPAKANPLSEDGAERNRWSESLVAQVELARKLGCDCIGFWPPALQAMQGMTEEQMLERLAAGLAPAAARAVSHGITAALEGEPPLVINTAQRLKSILQAVGKDLKVIFDPAHFDLLSGGNSQPEFLLKEIGVDRVGYVQFTDGDGTIRRQPSGAVGTSKHIAAGDGQYDLYAVLKTLYDGKFSGWIQIDTWETEDPYYASKAGRDTVKAVWTALSPNLGVSNP